MNCKIKITRAIEIMSFTFSQEIFWHLIQYYLPIRFIDLFKKYAKEGDKELKLKRPAQMKEVLEMTRELIVEKERDGISDNVEKLKVLKSVLEM